MGCIDGSIRRYTVDLSKSNNATAIPIVRESISKPTPKQRISMMLQPPTLAPPTTKKIFMYQWEDKNILSPAVGSYEKLWTRESGVESNNDEIAVELPSFVNVVTLEEFGYYQFLTVATEEGKLKFYCF